MNNITNFFWHNEWAGSAEPITLNEFECKHIWKVYEGLLQRDVYCEVCNKKVDYDEGMRLLKI